MEKNSNYIVQENEPEFDRDCLHRRLFLVNMRLYRSSPKYKELVKGVVDYQSWILDQEWSDYGKPKGISGANIGIPLCIIGFIVNGQKKFMLNPDIFDKSEEMVDAWSNCGSLKLPAKILVKRHKWISVRYYNIDGDLVIEEKIDRFNGGLTIQHEYWHCQGKTILDTQSEQNQVNWDGYGA